MIEGIDIPIEKVRQAISVKFTGLIVYGRIFQNERDGVLIPEALWKDNEYREVLPDDTASGVVFFDVAENREELTVNLGRADVNICCLLDLGKLYTGDQRPTEKAHREMRDVLLKVGIRPTELITGLKAIKPYDISAPEGMSPYYVFAFKTKVKYFFTLNNC